MALFNQLYQIKGLHADMVRKITDVMGCRNIDVFYISLVLGLWQGCSVEPDNESKIEPAKIDPEQMIRYGQDIEYLYELVMMNDKSSSISLKERVDKAFKIKGTDKAEKDEARFTSIMLGGLEFLYNNIIENTTSKEDIFNNICELIQTYLVAYPEKE